MGDVDPVREEKGKEVSLSTPVPQYSVRHHTSPHYRPYIRLSVVMKHFSSTSYWWTASRLDIWRLTFDKYKLFIGNILINRYAIKYESDTRFRSHSIYFLWNKKNGIFPTLLVDNTLHLIKSLNRLCPSQEDQGTHKYIT